MRRPWRFAFATDEAEFAPYVVAVALDGRGREAEHGGDLLGGLSGAEEADHLALARAERIGLVEGMGFKRGGPAEALELGREASAYDWRALGAQIRVLQLFHEGKRRPPRILFYRFGGCPAFVFDQIDELPEGGVL